jgi:hypothetical protein
LTQVIFAVDEHLSLSLSNMWTRSKRFRSIKSRRIN